MQVVVDTFITSTPLYPIPHQSVNLQSPVTLIVIFSRSRTGFRKTDTIINRFIRGAIQTSLLSSIFSLCNLITFILFPDMNFYAMFAFPVGRIYTNVSVCAMEVSFNNSFLLLSCEDAHEYLACS